MIILSFQATFVAPALIDLTVDADFIKNEKKIRKKEINMPNNEHIAVLYVMCKIFLTPPPL
jgi:hypothetical protein